MQGGGATRNPVDPTMTRTNHSRRPPPTLEDIKRRVERMADAIALAIETRDAHATSCGAQPGRTAPVPRNCRRTLANLRALARALHHEVDAAIRAHDELAGITDGMPTENLGGDPHAL